MFCKKFHKKKYEFLPSNVEITDEDLENDLIVITPTSNGAENKKNFN